MTQSEGDARRSKLKLETPPMRQNGKDVDWSALWLYRATACGQRKHRPVNTGDVFFQAPVFDLGEAVEKDVMVLQHPCAMRSTGWSYLIASWLSRSPRISTCALRETGWATTT